MLNPNQAGAPNAQDSDLQRQLGALSEDGTCMSPIALLRCKGSGVLVQRRTGRNLWLSCRSEKWGSLSR